MPVKRPSQALFRAFYACAGTPIEDVVRDAFTALMVKTNADRTAVAAELNVSERSASRVMSAYGWTRTQAALVNDLNNRNRAPKRKA